MARFKTFRDDKCLITATDHLLYLELLQGLHSLGQWILDHGATATMPPTMETICANLAPFLVGKRGCYDLLGKVVLLDR